MLKNIISVLVLPFLVYSAITWAAPKTKGIYINQGTLENSSRLRYLIDESKAVGINTFVVDLQKTTKNYQKNIDLIKSNGLRYVARIVVFPDGGHAKQIKSNSYWEDKYKLVENAISYGADEIQLDYIRYSTKQSPSPQNAKDVKEVIQFFKDKLNAKGIPLQIDIFGEVSFKESPRIGQNIQLFADTVDVVCPMVYPSHYHPYQKHSAEPYETVYKSLTSLKSKFDKMPFKLNPYIEASNYHYKWSNAKKTSYIISQIKAVEDANADGWFVWSPQNHYDNLFAALKSRTSNSANAKANDKAETKTSIKAESNANAEKTNASAKADTSAGVKSEIQ
ncbi:MAG: hypothetical protein JSS07_00090 [Proteobacteria bacterium]|nr:hypothetical protein [Pseudomonadota bacterium]